MVNSFSLLSVFSLVLTLGVVFVNGLTDAPNAISTATVTRCIKLKPALIMSAIFNFFGVVVMSSINNSVTVTISNIVDFGNNQYYSSVALSAALFSIVIWAVTAWYFGIPTSESHALVAGLTLNIFNKHCDRVRMANIAQTINVLQAVILTDGEEMILTPTYHIFKMYKSHSENTV